MKPSWCASLPVLSVPQSDQPKPVTFIYPYYLNARFLERQLGWWSTYPDHVKAYLSAIIVDDASPWPAVEVLRDSEQPFPIRLFRIQQDIAWNWLAARNIGAHHAADGWLLLTDMDHVVPASTAEALVYGAHDPATVYALSRMEHTGDKVRPHSASFFMTKAMFWTIGGYDERYSGNYGSDGIYRRRLMATAPLRILSDRLIRHEYQSDSSTVTYLRKQAADTERLQQITASIPKGTKPKVLSFEYHEVSL